MGSFGGTELIIIFLIILLVFGAKRIPEIARGLGKGIREFKDATTDIKREIETSSSYDDRPRTYAPPQSTPRTSPPPAQPTQATHPGEPQPEHRD